MMATISGRIRREITIAWLPGRKSGCVTGISSGAGKSCRDQQGEIVEVRCQYDPATRGGNAPDGRKVKGTIHWVSARPCPAGGVWLYEYLFRKADPDEVDEEGADWRTNLNPNSLEVVQPAYVEPSLASAAVGMNCQFERLGHFSRSRFDGRQTRL